MDPHIEPSAELQQTVNNESDYDIVSLPASDGSDVQTADEDNLMNEKVKEDQMYDQQPMKLAFVDAAHKAAVGTYTIRSQNLEMKPSSVINYRINCKYECAVSKWIDFHRIKYSQTDIHQKSEWKGLIIFMGHYYFIVIWLQDTTCDVLYGCIAFLNFVGR